MLFAKKPPLNILACATCRSIGFFGLKKCRSCRGMAVGYFTRDKGLYWNFPLTRYYLLLEKGRKISSKVRLAALFLLGVNFWAWFIFFIYQTGIFASIAENPRRLFDFYKNLSGGTVFLFYAGAVSFCYFWYRTMRGREFAGLTEKHDYNLRREGGPIKEISSVNLNWDEVLKLPSSKKINIAKAFTDESLSVLGAAFTMADKNRHNTVTPLHIFSVLLSRGRVSNVFLRLGLPARVIQTKLAAVLIKNISGNLLIDKNSEPRLSNDALQVIFKAYENAFSARQDYVSVTELLLAAAEESAEIQEVLYDLNVDSQKLLNAVEWARIRERLYRQYRKIQRAGAGRSVKGMDKAMTAVATPYLNKFSEDLTLLAQFGNLDLCVARENEINEAFRVVDSGRHGVIFVGSRGSGKRSIVEGLAQKMVEGDVPKRLFDKRLVRLSVSSLLSGTTPAGAVERLLNILREASRARNIILFIQDIHELAGVSTGGERGLSIADALAENLNRGDFMVFATTDTEEYAQIITGSPIGGAFTKIEVKEMDENQAIQVLESKVGYSEYKQKVFFSYDALEKAVKLSLKFIQDITLPGSALEIMSEAAALTRNKKGANALVTAEEVSQVVSEKTKIPVTSVTADESAKLLLLEEEMRKRVIGQDEAVGLVANALRRARAEIRSQNRPIANFLFLGPTGVGKTELAKTIAEVYFGGENRMTRLDMSEYQDKSGVYRLIGAPGEKGTGILTEAIRHNPFCLLLLDELEKADKDILNLFLQVMDDGRLTDSIGRVVDFTNAIIIATSNAGTTFAQEQMRAGISSEDIKERLLRSELKQYFRPEFLNRFDGIVLFKPLGRSEIKIIAGLMLKQVAKDLEAKGVELKAEDAALEFLADVGFDPEFGARPMRRAIQERVENKLAELVLSGKLKRRDTVIVGENGTITIKES
ncbi:MAG: ATP-dependent Clp protease ATP-binding subunit [Patescibacteria group bacterium]